MTQLDELRDRYDVVVVGGGVAAGALASTLVDGGFGGSVAVFCAEPHPPYTRPGRSKAVLRGEKDLDAPMWRPAAFYAEHGIDLVMGVAVTDIDRLGATVRAGGRSVGYGTLVLATGAEPRRIPVADGLVDRVHVLRSIADCARLRPHMQDGTSWLVIGGGFIGAEVAGSARMMGCEAAVVFPEDVVMERAFGDVVGGWFTDRLRDHGVELHPGSSVEELSQQDGRVAARLGSGETIVVDHVVVGIGVTPATGLAAQARLELEDGGVAVDANLRTSDERIFAIGDIAAYDSELHGSRVRIEHWAVAKTQGEHVARQLLGEQPGAYRELPYFFTGQGDWAYAEYVGVGTHDAVLRDASATDTLSAAYVEDGKLVGVIVVDAKDDLEAARELVPQRPVFHADRFTAGEPLAACVG
jgi:3-phenylpropionate/trans-cinnamate dioxygenase ferredoxin reductase subunit